MCYAPLQLCFLSCECQDMEAAQSKAVNALKATISKLTSKNNHMQSKLQGLSGQVKTLTNERQEIAELHRILQAASIE